MMRAAARMMKSFEPPSNEAYLRWAWGGWVLARNGMQLENMMRAERKKLYEAEREIKRIETEKRNLSKELLGKIDDLEKEIKENAHNHALQDALGGLERELEQLRNSKASDRVARKDA